LLEHAVRIPKDVVVPETQDAKAAASQVSIANLIAYILSMLTAICLNDEHLFE